MPDPSLSLPSCCALMTLLEVWQGERALIFVSRFFAPSLYKPCTLGFPALSSLARSQRDREYCISDYPMSFPPSQFARAPAPLPSLTSPALPHCFFFSAVTAAGAAAAGAAAGVEPYTCLRSESSSSSASCSSRYHSETCARSRGGVRSGSRARSRGGPAAARCAPGG